MTDPQENPLEKALRLAATDASFHPAFYALLMESEIFIVGHADGPAGWQTLEAGTEVFIQRWRRKDGSSFVPFFTSLSVLQKAIGPGTSYMELSVRSLFEITKGDTLALNPKSTYGKEFIPDEVEALLRTQ